MHNSYLNQRSQYTKINQLNSSIAAVPSGVKQGLVLGPILYLIYIDDVGSNDMTSDVIMFADDAALISQGTSPEESCEKLEKDLNTINN